VSISTIRFMHCDHGQCAAQAACPEPFGTPSGWTRAGNTDGCPAHGHDIEAHKANITSQTSGRGPHEKTTWYLTCACGWRSNPWWVAHSAAWLRAQHIEHVRQATSGAPHPTCIDVTAIDQEPRSAWTCGPDCPKEA
jgi:hypothetical protein